MAEYKIGKTSEIAKGSGKTFEVEGKSIAVFNVGGNFVGIDNTCKHRGGSLGDGTLSGDTVTCLLHGWQYSVINGECLTNSAVKLDCYPVKVHGEDIAIEV